MRVRVVGGEGGSYRVTSVAIANGLVTVQSGFRNIRLDYQWVGQSLTHSYVRNSSKIVYLKLNCQSSISYTIDVFKNGFNSTSQNCTAVPVDLESQ